MKLGGITMNIKAFIHNGRLRLDEPVDLPEGAEVKVSVSPVASDNLGMTEEELGDSPEAIASWIAYYESLEPPTMTEQEWEAWQQRRREDRAWELSHAEARAQKLQRMFE